MARHWKESELEVALAFARLPEAQADRRRRRYLMEGSFAHAANRHHFKRARWRRLWRQQIQDWLIAAVQNIALLCGGICSGVGATPRKAPKSRSASAAVQSGGDEIELRASYRTPRRLARHRNASCRRVVDFCRRAQGDFRMPVWATRPQDVTPSAPLRPGDERSERRASLQQPDFPRARGRARRRQGSAELFRSDVGRIEMNPR